MTAPRPTPHLDKLRELLANTKLPTADRSAVADVLMPRYRHWVESMGALEDRGDALVERLVAGLNAYKRAVELDLVWDSEGDFLWRQRGQLKLESSIMEEFLPWLADPRVVPALDGRSFVAGPRTTFSGAYFVTSLDAASVGLTVRTKDQDFAISREAWLKASFDPSFPPDQTASEAIHVAFLAAECKTNLDKSMFQESVATAHDVKVAVPGARYYLLCEWLDMSPISTASTDIDEAIVLRGKRINSNVRERFSQASERRASRAWFADFVEKNPVHLERVIRFVNHIRTALARPVTSEGDVLQRGYF